MLKRCKDCNSTINDQAMICPKCNGTEFYQEEQELERKVAMQAYRGLLRKKWVHSEYVAYHYYQGKVLFCLMMIPLVTLLFQVIYWQLLVPIDWQHYSISWVYDNWNMRPVYAYFLLLPLQFLGIHNAKHGLCKRLPIIGYFGELFMKKRSFEIQKDDNLQVKRLRGVPILPNLWTYLCVFFLVMAILDEF